MYGKVAWKIGYLAAERYEVLPWDGSNVRPKLLQAAQVFIDLSGAVAASGLGHLVDNIRRHAYRLAYLPDGIARLEGNIGADHGDVLLTVLLIDILD